MSDRRFFVARGPVDAGTLAERLGGRLIARNEAAVSIEDVCSAVATADRALFYLATLKGVDTGAIRPDAVCLTTETLAQKLAGLCHLIVVGDPRSAFGVGAHDIVGQRLHPPGEGLIAASARVHPDAIVMPNVAIGPDAEIGAGARLDAGVVIGPGVAIGRNTHIGANSVIQCALIGDGCILGPCCTIGQPGFGISADRNGLLEMPHFGRVILQDRVSLGASVAVDRGMFDDTVIGENSKFDNLCQIAHNVVIGRNSLAAAFAGISGSVTIGDGVQIGGMVCLHDHIEIGDGAKLGANSAYMHSVPAGETWGGYPAQPLRKFFREVAWLRKQVNMNRSEES